MNLPRPVVLCADDFGLTDGVSRGIVELAGLGRLSATSAMTNLPAWRRNAPLLRDVRHRIGIGLHLNLTTGCPLAAMPGLAAGGSFPALKDLLRMAFTLRLPLSELKAEIARQIDAFEQIHGAAPAFVDGHQHVHVLPGIRQALLDVLSGRGYAGRLWLRDPSDRLPAILRRRTGAGKALTVHALAAGFRRDAMKANFKTNRGFSGFSPLKAETEAASMFHKAFSCLGPKPLVMCHPGHLDDELRDLDPAVESRAAEWAYLMSDEFTETLKKQAITLARVPEGQ